MYDTIEDSSNCISKSCFFLLFRPPVSTSCFDLLFLLPVSTSCLYLLSGPHVDHLHAEANVLKVREHSELLSAQYFARCLEPENVNNSITTRDSPKRRMKETLFTRHRSTVEPMIIAKDRKATLQAIHIMAVNQDVTSLRRNVVLDDRPPLINISEKELTRRERTTLPPLRSGYCRLLGSFKGRISRDASLDVVVVVRLPRPMEGNGVTPIFRSLQNCQFHHRRLESLEHFNVLYIYIILSTTVSHFWTLRMFFF